MNPLPFLNDIFYFCSQMWRELIEHIPILQVRVVPQEKQHFILQLNAIKFYIKGTVLTITWTFGGMLLSSSSKQTVKITTSV